MRKLYLIIAINSLLPLLLIVLPSLLIRIRVGASNLTSQSQIPLLKDKPVTFSFNSNYSKLQSLSLDFKNPNLNNNSEIDVDIQGPTDNRSVVFFGSNLGDPSTIPLKFPAFSDPPNTQYNITINTENIKDGGLYLLADKNNLPVFRSFYQETNLENNLKLNLNRQIELIQNRSQIHNFIYLLLIIILNCSIILI